MLIKRTTITPQLAGWLAKAHDDGAEPLRISQTGEHILVSRSDGSDPSETETLEIAALIAADGVK